MSTRGVWLVPLVLLAAAVAVVVAAALTTWWVLLALIPLAMMLGCGVRMAARGGMPCVPGARRGCCAVGAPPFGRADPEREAPPEAVAR